MYSLLPGQKYKSSLAQNIIYNLTKNVFHNLSPVQRAAAMIISKMRTHLPLLISLLWYWHHGCSNKNIYWVRFNDVLMCYTSMKANHSYVNRWTQSTWSNHAHLPLVWEIGWIYKPHNDISLSKNLERLPIYRCLL